MQDIEFFDFDEQNIDDDWRIHSDGELGFAFRKIAQHEAAISKNNDFADGEIEKIEKWREKRNGVHQAEVDHFKTLIHEYHSRKLAEDPKAKTISTPWGRSKSRVSKAAPEKTDDDALLIWAKNAKLDDFIKTEEKLQWGTLKKSLRIAGDKVVDENGEIVPGVAVKPESVTYSVDLEE